MYAITCKRSLERRQERGGGHREKEEESLEREERGNMVPQTSPAHELQHIVRTFILKNPGESPTHIGTPMCVFTACW